MYEQSRPKSLWAELRRKSAVNLIPEPVWVSLLGRIAPQGEHPVWDEREMSWLVSARMAKEFSIALRDMESSYFRRTTAHFEGPIVSGTMRVAGLTPAAAHEAREELLGFLEGGSFSWRFISL